MSWKKTAMEVTVQMVEGDAVRRFRVNGAETKEEAFKLLMEHLGIAEWDRIRFCDAVPMVPVVYGEQVVELQEEKERGLEVEKLKTESEGKATEMNELKAFEVHVRQDGSAVRGFYVEVMKQENIRTGVKCWLDKEGDRRPFTVDCVPARGPLDLDKLPPDAPVLRWSTEGSLQEEWMVSWGTTEGQVATERAGVEDSVRAGASATSGDKLRGLESFSVQLHQGGRPMRMFYVEANDAADAHRRMKDYLLGEMPTWTMDIAPCARTRKLMKGAVMELVSSTPLKEHEERSLPGEEEIKTRLELSGWDAWGVGKGPGTAHKATRPGELTNEDGTLTLFWTPNGVLKDGTKAQGFVWAANGVAAIARLKALGMTDHNVLSGSVAGLLSSSETPKLQAAVFAYEVVVRSVAVSNEVKNELVRLERTHTKSPRMFRDCPSCGAPREVELRAAPVPSEPLAGALLASKDLPSLANKGFIVENNRLFMTEEGKLPDKLGEVTGWSIDVGELVITFTPMTLRVESHEADPVTPRSSS